MGKDFHLKLKVAVVSFSYYSITFFRHPPLTGIFVFIDCTLFILPGKDPEDNVII